MNKKKIPRRLDPGRDGDRHRDRLHDLRQLPRQEGGHAGRRLHLDHVGCLPAPDQDADRPLVFSTLVVGIAHMGDAASVGRVFAKALGWFVIASLFSLVLGLIMANWLQPGHNLGLPLPDIGSATNLATSSSRSRISSAIWCQVLRRGHGQQRDPADRGVLHVLRRGAGRAGREGQDAGGRGRRTGARDAQDHRLRDEAGAAGGDGGHGGHRGGQRPGHPAEVRRLHGRLLHQLVHAVGPADPGGLPVPRAARARCWC